MSILRSLTPRALIMLVLMATLFSVAPRPASASSTSTWNTLVMVYRTTDATYTVDGTTRRLRSSMTSTDVSRAVEHVKRVPGSVNSWSGGYARMRQTIVYPANPVRSLTSLGSNGYWLAPSNIKADLDWFAPPGRYDSIFVIWRHDDDRGNAIPSYGWGWTLRPSTGANGAGYSVVNIPDAHKAWPGTTPEQIWMHEWTHQTVGFYGRKGWAMPDIHAPASYGYLREQYGKIFLSDVMRGRVPTSSGYIGLNSTVWASGTPTGNYTPRTVSASPSTTTSYVGKAQTVTMTYSDANGWKDVRWASARLISSNGRPAVSLLYNRSTNRMYVRSRDGSRWIGGYTPGPSNTIAPGQATVKVKASSVSGSGDTLTVRWSVAFESPTRGGNYGVNLRVSDRKDAVAQRLGVATRYVR